MVTSTIKHCPFCAEEVQGSAQKCRFCGEWLICQKCQSPLNGAISFCAQCGAAVRGIRAASVSSSSRNMQPWTAPSQLQSDEEPEYAGFWVRFVALMVDGLVLTIPVIIVAVTIIGPLLVVWLYTALMMSSGKQGTLGMMALGLRVTDEHGNRVTFGKATGRYFGSILSGIILYIGYLMLLGNRRKQTLHDQMAGTLILRGRGTLQARRRETNYTVRQEPAEESPKLRAEASLRLCDTLITQVEQESVALDLLPGDSQLRQQYLRSLQVRADGAWMLDRAGTPGSFEEADKRLNEAVAELRAVRDALTGGVTKESSR